MRICDKLAVINVNRLIFKNENILTNTTHTCPSRDVDNTCKKNLKLFVDDILSTYLNFKLLLFYD